MSNIEMQVHRNWLDKKTYYYFVVGENALYETSKIRKPEERAHYINRYVIFITNTLLKPDTIDEISNHYGYYRTDGLPIDLYGDTNDYEL